MNGYLVAGLVLVLMGFAGCAGSLRDNTIRTANATRDGAEAAHDATVALCLKAAQDATTSEQEDRIKAACDKAEDAWAAFRAVWLVFAAAEETATDADAGKLEALAADVTRAGAAIVEAEEEIRALL